VELGREPAPHSVFFSAAASERARVGGLSLVRFGAIRLSVRQCWLSWLGISPLKSSDCSRGARQAASQFGRASRDPYFCPCEPWLARPLGRPSQRCSRWDPDGVELSHLGVATALSSITPDEPLSGHDNRVLELRHGLQAVSRGRNKGLEEVKGNARLKNNEESWARCY
jgi:hypothetical protein